MADPSKQQKRRKQLIARGTVILAVIAYLILFEFLTLRELADTDRKGKR